MLDLNTVDITMYVSGVCDKKNGPGGYAVIMSGMKHGEEITGGDCKTNKLYMVLSGIVEGLSQIQHSSYVTVYCDCEPIVEYIECGALDKWKSSNWRVDNRLLYSVELWQRLYGLLSRHVVNFRYVRNYGSMKGLAKCNKLATWQANRTKRSRSYIW